MPPRVEGQLSDALIAGFEDGVIGVDRVGGIRIFNKAAAGIFSLDPREVLGRSIWDALPKSEFSRTFIAQVKDSDPQPVQRLMLFPPNRMYAVRMQAVRSEHGRNLGAYAVLRDVTGVRQIEQGLDDIFATLTREISIPLTTIKGFVETLLEGAYLDSQVTRRFLQIINDEANNLVRLVMSLDSAVKNKEMGPHNVRFRLEELLKECLAVFVPVAESKNISMELNVGCELPWITADPKLIRQAFINILDNAVRFVGVKGGGFVKVEVSCQDRKFKVTVSDNGIGITAADLPHIFERFFRGSSNKARSLGGVGLGLSVTENIIKAHKGSIEVVSKPDEGAVFTVLLPVRS